MIEMLLDPDKALDAVNKAVNLVKKAAATAQNVESLGPVLGKYFDAKATAIASAQQAKAGGFGGSMKGKALEIEMAIESQKDFENQVKMLFFQSNKMDVWLRIEARARQMEVEAAKASATAKRASAKRRRKVQETIEYTVGFAFLLIVAVASIWFAIELVQYCKQAQCGA